MDVRFHAAGLSTPLKMQNQKRIHPGGRIVVAGLRERGASTVEATRAAQASQTSAFPVPRASILILGMFSLQLLTPDDALILMQGVRAGMVRTGRLVRDRFGRRFGN